jgi:quercetin dioxygenase-like cupin family protein
MIKKLSLCAGIVALLLGAPESRAQQPDPIKRTILQRAEFPGDKMATLLVLIEVIPNGLVARHTHPGVEIGYILEGSAEFTIEGQSPKLFRQGDSYMVPVTAPHVVKAGAAGVKLIGTFVVDKDKPLASPAP